MINESFKLSQILFAKIKKLLFNYFVSFLLLYLFFFIYISIYKINSYCEQIKISVSSIISKLEFENSLLYLQREIQSNMLTHQGALLNANVKVSRSTFNFAEFKSSSSFFDYTVNIEKPSVLNQNPYQIKIQISLDRILILFVLTISIILFSFLRIQRIILASINNITTDFNSSLFQIINKFNDQLLRNISSTSEEKKFLYSEINFLSAFLKEKYDLLIKLQESLDQKLVNESIGITAKQVAHDIRSPLSALNMIVNTLDQVSYEKRDLIKNSVQRINDIANDLLNKSKSLHPIAHAEHLTHFTDVTLNSTVTHSDQDLIPNQQFYKSHTISTLEPKSSLELKSTLLFTCIEQIISEKRIQHRDLINLNIEVIPNNCFDIFVNINPSLFQRIISNLINNSVEAIDPAQDGEVTIQLHKKNGSVEILIADNGKGIPKNILDKIGKTEISFGKNNHQQTEQNNPHSVSTSTSTSTRSTKSSTSSGSGIGLKNAFDAIKQMSGQITIDSIENKFTEVSILLPITSAPEWFTHEIILSSDQKLVSLDDDISVHQIWDQHLKVNDLDRKIQHISFTSMIQFKNWYLKESSESPNSLNKYKFLIDQEFINNSITGLMIIKDLKIAPQSILVSSQFEEESLQLDCIHNQIKLIPKHISGFCKISYNDIM